MDAAKARIENLNPLVAVETMTSPPALEREEFDALVQSVDLVCITDSERDFIVSAWLAAPGQIRGSRGARIDSRKRCMQKVEEAVVRGGNLWPPWLHLL